ncbi:hypothetical protein KGP26_27675 [Serratia sp. JSRIV002]|uniref:hypothetical protein n=1 Tax=Serratia sp. JSRIV002 TaxID=2831894 RepID=UPI001CC0A198|nr:hypothetical protein [Serratia sp. JSRIV002]UAN51395.1 hypothetical protein KGP26_27675 [Serratia sp. JSRIV002]
MALNLNETTILSAINGGGIFAVIGSVLVPSYGVYFSSSSPKVGQKALVYDTTVSFARQNDSVITTAPLERGDYQAFNKVKRPAEINLVVAFEGWTGYSGAVPNLPNFTATSRTDFLKTLDNMVASADTYDIETPDDLFYDYDLSRYDYKIDSKSGVTMLLVSMVFQAVPVTVKTSKATINKNTKSDAALVTEKNDKAATREASIDDVNKAIRSARDMVPSAQPQTVNTVSRAVLGLSGEAQLKSAVKTLIGLIS